MVTNEPDLVTSDYNLLAERALVNKLITDQNAIDIIHESNIVDFLFHPEVRDIVNAAIDLNKSRQPVIKATLLEKIPNLSFAPYEQRIDGDILVHLELIKSSYRVREAKRLFTLGLDSINKGNVGEVLENTINSINSLGYEESNDRLKHIKFPLEEMLEKVRHAANCRDGIVGLPTGLKTLDKITGGLRPGELTIVAGRPGSGKSSLAFEWLSYAASQGFGTVGFSLEMPSDMVTLRLACSRANILISDARNGKIGFDDLARLESNAKQMEMWPFILDDRSSTSIADIRSQLRRVKFEFKRLGVDLSLLVVDYIQLMRPLEGGNREQEISSISRELKRISKEYNIPVVALSQLNREVERREDKRPMMSDLRDSGGIEQDADCIIMIYRDEYYNRESKHKGIAEIIIQKHRNGETGTLYVGFDAPYTRFRDLTLAERAKAGLPGT